MIQRLQRIGAWLLMAPLKALAGLAKAFLKLRGGEAFDYDLANDMHKHRLHRASQMDRHRGRSFHR